MKVAVGLSGGVDSSVAAALLTEYGYEVISLFMKLWDGGSLAAGGYNACYGPDEASDVAVARAVARQLAIPFHEVDLAGEFKAEVLAYFKQEYLAGRTPNPCVRCNHRIKFGVLIERARQAGIDFDYFATGHYAKVAYCTEKKRFLLKKGRDARKDQSYWLAFLGQQQLAMTIFPLGDYTKAEVRRMARRYGLSSCDRPDSQDFYAGDYTHLIAADARPGPIIDRSGRVLGVHQGMWRYTIGQRKGLGIAAKEPLYVIDFDRDKNAVVVGFAAELSHNGLVASNLNLISTDALHSPASVAVKIRSTQKTCAGVVTQLDSTTASVHFAEPQSAITAGQAAVFYDGDCVLGAAIIDRAVD